MNFFSNELYSSSYIHHQFHLAHSLALTIIFIISGSPLVLLSIPINPSLFTSVTILISSTFLHLLHPPSSTITHCSDILPPRSTLYPPSIFVHQPYISTSQPNCHRIPLPTQAFTQHVPSKIPL
ncbi:unnamed protein product [Vicia faba]|uniref:Uncharacterized protein n=1 Tax=Vicia faba TaxID=3906 RepID=A0AAV0Z4C4_VICFA|nr:unnamed protein product [Vicia faba]